MKRSRFLPAIAVLPQIASVPAAAEGDRKPAKRQNTASFTEFALSGAYLKTVPGPTVCLHRRFPRPRWLAG